MALASTTGGVYLCSYVVVSAGRTGFFVLFTLISLDLNAVRTLESFSQNTILC